MTSWPTCIMSCNWYFEKGVSCLGGRKFNLANCASHDGTSSRRCDIWRDGSGCSEKWGNWLEMLSFHDSLWLFDRFEVDSDSWQDASSGSCASRRIEEALHKYELERIRKRLPNYATIHLFEPRYTVQTIHLVSGILSQSLLLETKVWFLSLSRTIYY